MPARPVIYDSRDHLPPRTEGGQQSHSENQSVTSSSTLPQCVKSDPNLFKDDIDIRFSTTYNNCKIPQIRYATPERLLQRLTDLRFLNIDFLNTFLLTYKVFTDGITVLEALKNVFYNSPDSSSSSYAG